MNTFYAVLLVVLLIVAPSLFMLLGSMVKEEE